ncbi:hypothetical protein [Solirubrobacter soli]|uniref:hypothetical protein n=1 Tax=Solirubrobacter soli TaxID=363832 RepID=UPI00041FDE73|nr:hypothetical protein [Solirubrobacter soli]
MTTEQRSRLGAYGFRLEGLADAAGLLVEAPQHWPSLTLRRVAGGAPFTGESVTDEGARLWLAGGALADLHRAAGRADLEVPQGTTDGAIVHPYLAPVALVWSRWLGREGFHGGGIVADGGVWAVLGEKTAGKSTTLAWLARAGVPVFSDDVLIVDGELALAGPRSLDLREEAAERLGVGELMGRVGARDRWRVTLDPVPAELPLRGWVTLDWGDAVAVEPLRGADRLRALFPHRGVFLEPAVPSALVRFSALPHLRLVRPRGWDSLPEAAGRLLDAVAG